MSTVDEESLLAKGRAQGPLEPREAVLTLARAKAEDVAGAVSASESAVVVGCDSMLEVGGELVGKPHTAAVARERWRAMRGTYGVLHTGHWVVDTRTGRSVGDVSSTTVHFAYLNDEEIDTYVASGEPLEVAGAFTVDGRGAAFVTSIQGDHHAVVGISIATLRLLLRTLDISITDLWSSSS